MSGPPQVNFSYTDFTPVASRKKRKSRLRKDRPASSVLLQRIRDDLRQDDWLTHSQQIVGDGLKSLSYSTPDVLCLGLGSPTSSQNACVQLGFLLELCEYLDVDRAKVSIYDPAFAAEDILLLEELQVRPLTENKHGEYLLDVPTICFMPHCDRELYESVLKANWTPERLPNIIFLANRFADYIDSNPIHELQIRVPRLVRIVPTLDSKPLPASKLWPTAFNNTSLQFVGKARATDTWFSDLPPLPDQSKSCDNIPGEHPDETCAAWAESGTAPEESGGSANQATVSHEIR